MMTKTVLRKGCRVNGRIAQLKDRDIMLILSHLLVNKGYWVIYVLDVVTRFGWQCIADKYRLINININTGD